MVLHASDPAATGGHALWCRRRCKGKGCRENLKGGCEDPKSLATWERCPSECLQHTVCSSGSPGGIDSILQPGLVGVEYGQQRLLRLFNTQPVNVSLDRNIHLPGYMHRTSCFLITAAVWNQQPFQSTPSHDLIGEKETDVVGSWDLPETIYDTRPSSASLPFNCVCHRW